MQLFTDVTALVAGNSINQGALTVSYQGNSVDLFNGNVSCNLLAAIGPPATGCTVTTAQLQVEEWSGITTDGSTWTTVGANGSGPGPMVTTITGLTAGGGTLLVPMIGLRTYRYARANLIAITCQTTANVPVSATILEMPKNEGGATAAGYSNWPSSGSTNGT